MIRTIFEQIPIATIIVNRDGSIYSANEEATKVFAYSVDEFKSRNLNELIPQDFRDRHNIFLQHYFNNPLKRKMGEGRELKGQKKDGSTFPVEIGLCPIEIDGDSKVMATVIDITYRIKGEERFRYALEGVPNGIIMVNKDGKIALTNNNFCEIFGYSKDELLGLDIETVVPAEIKSVHPSLLSSFMANPSRRAMGSNQELFGQHKNGSKIPVEIGLQPLHYDDGIYVIASVVDISERKLAEQKIRENNEEILEFSYRTSHDLKAPLVTASGILDFIIEDLKQKEIEEILADACRVKALLDNLGRTITDILDLAKADHDSEEYIKFDFEKYKQDVLQRLALDPTNLGIEISINNSLTLPLFTSTVRMTQILDNFISNAIKYADKKKSHSFIKFHVFNDNDFYYIQAQDNGVGIPEQSHGKVFQMFKRFHSNEFADGSGLGLYLVKKHVMRLGGEISFTSSPEGTTFYLKLPLLTSGAKKR